MLDLQPGVHFHEVVRAVGGDDEFDRARPDIADGHCRPHRRRTHGRAPLGGHAGSRRLLEHLLVPPLHRAVPFEQMHALAVAVREYLELDVPRSFDVLLDQYLLIAKARGRFALAAQQRRIELCRTLDFADAATPTPIAGLDEQRVADAVGFTAQQCGILIFTVVARGECDAGPLQQRFGRRLRAHHPHRRRGRADEHETLLLAAFREEGIFRQEAIAGMYGLRTAAARGRNDGVDPQITLGSRMATDGLRLIAGTQRVTAKLRVRSPNRPQWFSRIPRRCAVRAIRQAISPRLAMSRRSSRIAPCPLHPEDAETGRRDRCIQTRRQPQRQDLPGIGRIDDAVIPQPRRGVVGVSLPVILFANRRRELRFFLGAPGGSFGLEVRRGGRGPGHLPRPAPRP